MKRKTALGVSVLAASLVALAGCDKPKSPPAAPATSSSAGPMEKAGAKAGQAIDDTAITAAVKAGILAEPGLKVLKIDVDTKEGKVTLTGSADSADNVKRAEQIASNVQGVKSVDNRVAVSSKG